MHIDEVRARASCAGVATTARMRKADIIRAIQRAEGHQDCFASAWRFDCPWFDCCWRSDCQSKSGA